MWRWPIMNTGDLGWDNCFGRVVELIDIDDFDDVYTFRDVLTDVELYYERFDVTDFVEPINEMEALARIAK